MLDHLAKAIAYYPEDLRREVGGVEAAANIKRVQGLKDKQRSLRGRSADQIAKAIKPEDWK
jgi:predicted metal-dependent hydrolase